MPVETGVNFDALGKAKEYLLQGLTEFVNWQGTINH